MESYRGLLPSLLSFVVGLVDREWEDLAKWLAMASSVLPNWVSIAVARCIERRNGKGLTRIVYSDNDCTDGSNFG